VGLHEQLGDQAPAYVLGALTPAERLAFEAHLAECAICAAEVRSLAPVTAGLARLVPEAEPAPEVRQRLLAAIAKPSSWSASWLAAASSVALAVVLGGYSAQLRARVAGLESQLREATRRAEASEGQVA